MASRFQPRVDFAPIRPFIQARIEELRDTGSLTCHEHAGRKGSCPCVRETYRDNFGIEDSSIHRIRRNGHLTVWMADKISLRLGHHPTAIWGVEAWDAATKPTTKQLEAA